MVRAVILPDHNRHRRGIPSKLRHQKVWRPASVPAACAFPRARSIIPATASHPPIDGHLRRDPNL
jgi:hypothetical protein